MNHINAVKSNNPIGGLGLTTGLLDAAALGNVLIRVLIKGEDANADELLDRYAQVRRKAFAEYSNPQSIENKYRLHSQDEQVNKKRNAFFHALTTKPKETSTLMASQMNQFLDDDFAV
jgi:2-polyprenyl-6-methoxyphenol hydroxylase-like FAD-dependent oxidoreductase